ncbi:alpha-glucosidase family protein [Marinimicrobium sp. ABcell2]|uniref:alpha-glucosidase family protein n=1 Tax=Marinimicrobium sp. ABcell2 TaxID=3069751 RepID=UPI0027B7CDB5|nr:alpha-glucosidase family protein [Marinimicrobium sp. ABcell2]MDQ2077316.1 alpha-glucosidase family protein [Marinimicrobium sp. ABcell2]
MQTNPWWRGAVIYQVYPRSLMDSNGDGIGDLPGIISKLDYIASLGVDAVWISPFFKSPMKDFGYDISDYRDIDPIFGTLDDFDRLIAEAHDRDIRIIIDQVLSHTSDQHPWFEQSRQCRKNDKADWYVWADPAEDGTPPNNWLSIFGGVAWEWEPRRCQYYLHNFLKSQPDLNFHNPEVQNEILSEVEFWLKRGVDGFRLDAINFCFHDQQLRNNPSKPEAERKGRGFTTDNPYAYQRHLYDNTRPENLSFLKRLRQLIDKHPGVVTLGEISSEDSLKTMADYTAGNERLHMAYSFELLAEDLCPQYVRNTVSTLESGLGEGWPCWAIGNHDVVRVMSRWGNTPYNPEQAKMLNALQLSLRGSVCTYQGEELGLTEAEILQDQLQDPYGIAFWPRFKGRDGCRTPMPWKKSAPQAGFSEAVHTWLPIPATHRALAVDQQAEKHDSILNHYRCFVRWRKQQPGLIFGDIDFVHADNNILVFTRTTEHQKLLVAFNFSQEPGAYDTNDQPIKQLLDGHGLVPGQWDGKTVTLPGYGAAFALLHSR